jgi:thioredoxin-dependent peroxiredoxin
MMAMKQFTCACILSLLTAVALAGCQAPSRAAAMEEAAADASPLKNLPAPDFTLADENGKAVALRSLRGQWVVLYFYPKDDTPGCTREATDFTQLLTEFRGMNAQVLGVSADPSAAHRDFIAKYCLKLTLLSDPHHEVMRQYGAWSDSSFNGSPYGRVIRSTFIIDPAGVIRYHMPEVTPEGHAARVRQKLAELQKVSAPQRG